MLTPYSFYRGLFLKIHQAEAETCVTLADFDLNDKREIQLFRTIVNYLWFKAFKTWKENIQRVDNQDRVIFGSTSEWVIETCWIQIADPPVVQEGTVEEDFVALI